MTTKKEKRLIVVLGMHRSGTSAITRALQVMGVELGENLMPAVQNVNEKGFWEDLDLYTLNNELLETLHSEWHYLSPFMPRDLEILRANGYIAKAGELLLKKIEKREVFGFKDPRTAKLLDFWKEVFHQVQLDPSYVLALRHPLSVAKSLAKRDEFDAEKGYYLWLEHVLASLSGTIGTKRVLVDYDRLVQSPEFEINRIGKQINLTVNFVELKRYISEFLDKTLRHTVYDLSDLAADDSCPALAREMYATLINVASDSIHLNDPALLPHVKNWTKEFQRLKPALDLVDRLSAQNLIRKEINTESTQDLHLDQTQTITERNTRLTRLAQAVIERDNRIKHLNQTVLERDGQIAWLTQAVAERDSQINRFNEIIIERGKEIDRIMASISWRSTYPFRQVKCWLLRLTEQTKRELRNSNPTQARQIVFRENYLTRITSFSPVATARSNKEFDLALSLNVFDEIKQRENKLLSARAEHFVSEGICIPCNAKVSFIVDMAAGGGRIGTQWIPNWRERLACPQCNMNNRQRLMATLVKKQLEKHTSDVAGVYLMEQVTPIFTWVQKEFSQHQIYGSEYLGSNLIGGTNVKGVRHEDVMNLSFDNDSIDLIISNDVFEHVPNPSKAFIECARILKAGGIMLATFPFFKDLDKSVARAELTVDGLKHLLPPTYHGNPISEKGSLVFTDFGWDVLEDIGKAGFVDVRLELYVSAEFGHLGGPQIVFIAEK